MPTGITVIAYINAKAGHQDEVRRASVRPGRSDPRREGMHQLRRTPIPGEHHPVCHIRELELLSRPRCARQSCCPAKLHPNCRPPLGASRQNQQVDDDLRTQQRIPLMSSRTPIVDTHSATSRTADTLCCIHKVLPAQASDDSYRDMASATSQVRSINSASAAALSRWHPRTSHDK